MNVSDAYADVSVGLLWSAQSMYYYAVHAPQHKSDEWATSIFENAAVSFLFSAAQQAMASGSSMTKVVWHSLQTTSWT